MISTVAVMLFAAHPLPTSSNFEVNCKLNF